MFYSRKNKVAQLVKDTSRELDALRHLLRQAEAEKTRLQSFIDNEDRNKQAESQRRLANYLGAGSVQMLSPHRFRDDMIRARWLRRGLSATIIAVVGLVIYLLFF